MTDRELLEAAAKAAGMSYVHDLGVLSHDDFNEFVRWNPLTDDGDALRLAVRLRLVLFLEIPRIGIGPRMDGPEVYVDEGENEYAATRRAIVRAAAELGRSRT
jgi:hypothetical protein